MKKLILFSCLFLCFMSTRASHVAGGELSFECQGNGSYKFTYTFYRDCFGIPAPTFVTLVIDNSCGFPQQTCSLSLVTMNPQVINPTCGALTTCQGGNVPGIQKIIYEGTFTFSANCIWTFGVSLSSRNAAITTFQDPDSYNLYVFGSLDNSECDTSPVFNEEPIFFICANQTTCIDLGTTDPEGDSLVYSLIQPFVDPNTVLVYDTGYSVLQPVQSFQSLTFDSTTGMMCVSPSQLDVTVYAVLVQAYRNGVLISQVERDIELYVVQCAGAQPTLSGINGSSASDTIVCFNQPFCFDIYSLDMDSVDITNVNWDNGISTANFTVTAMQNSSAQFCWIPGIADTGITPHCFTAYVIDNSCPAHQTNSRTYCITVVDSATCATLSSKEIITSIDFRIYPIPAENIIHFDFGNNFQSGELVITNSIGQVLFQNKISGNEISINLDNFRNGIYFANVKQVNEEFVKKKFVVIKQ